MAGPYAVKMPQLSDTMTEGVIVSWEKKIGDQIKRGDIVATVETDKAIMDVEVFRDGYLSGPLVAPDSVVPVGDAMAYIVASATEVVSGSATPAAAPATVVHAVPQAAAVPMPSAIQSAEPAGALHTIKMPQLSDTMTEGMMVGWSKNPGDKVERGDIVAQVETDKAIMDVEVFRDGYLSGPIAAVDSVVPVGGALAYLVEKPEQVMTETASVQTSAKPASAMAHAAPAITNATTQSIAHHPKLDTGATPAPRPDNKHATPYARKLSGALHVNLNNLRGTGPSGIIVGNDVLHAQPIERPTEIARQPAAHVMPEIQVPGHGRAMNAMERAVSHSMTASLTMPTFHVTVNARPDALIKASKKKGVSLTVAIAKACALAMKRHPTLNWAYQPVDKLVERDVVDIGMAVSAEGGGLVVPVLRHCESRSLEDLDASWKDLVARARVRRLKPEEYANPTFMVSNMGMLGVSYFDAIPTPGTAAILAIASAGTQGMPLTITADHRVYRARRHD